MATLSPSIFAELVPQRQDVEQPLGRVLVLPVAGVDDVGADPLRRETPRRPRHAWRITTMSIRIASRLRAVSTRVSPLLTEDPWAATLTVSAESRFSANSKLMRVRVEASKKRLTIVFPRRAGTFLIGRSLTSLNGSAVSRMSRICSARERLERRRGPCPGRGTLQPPPHDQLHGIPAVQFRHQDVHPVAGAGADGDPDDVRLDRQLPAPAVDQHAEQDPPGPAEVGELIERGAHRPAGVEHVVHDDDGLAVERPGGWSRRPPAAGRSPADRRGRA